MDPEECVSDFSPPLDEPDTESQSGVRSMLGRHKSADESAVSFLESHYQMPINNRPLDSISEKTTPVSAPTTGDYDVPKSCVATEVGSESAQSSEPTPLSSPQHLENRNSIDKAYQMTGERQSLVSSDSGNGSMSPSQRTQSEVYSEIGSTEPSPMLLHEGRLSRQVLTQHGAKSHVKRWYRLTKRITGEGFIGELTSYFDKESLFSRLVIRGINSVSPVETSSGRTNSQNSFELKTRKRKYIFTAANHDEMRQWIERLNQIMQVEGCLEDWEKDGGELLYDPNQKGFIEVKSMQPLEKECKILGSKFVAIKGPWFCIYKDERDFNDDVPMMVVQMGQAEIEATGIFDVDHELVLHLGSSIELGFAFDSVASLAKWQSTMEEAIAEGRRLQPRSVWFRVRNNASNRACADCGNPDPDWAVVNWGIVVCKNCCVAHREVGVLNLRIMSLKTDDEDWRAEELEIISSIGNDRALDILGGNVLRRSSSQFERKNFVIAKYKLKSFCDRRRNQGDLDSALTTNLKTNNLKKTLQLIVFGANITEENRYLSGHKSLYHFALSFGQNSQAALIELHSNPSKCGEINSYSTEQPMKDFLTVLSTKRKSSVLKKSKQKMKVNKKQFCVSNDGFLKCFEGPDSLDALDLVSLRDVTLISEIKNNDVFGDRDDLHGFFISTPGKVHNYATETYEKKIKWMRSLAFNTLPSTMQPFLEERFQRFGKLTFKMNDAQKPAWVVLKDTILWVFVKETESAFQIELRKDIKACRAFHPDATSNLGVYLTGFQILFQLPDGGSICLQAEDKQRTEEWLLLIIGSRKAGDRIEEQLLSQRNVPVLIETCLDNILSYGIESKGVYKHSGVEPRISRLLARFQEDANAVSLQAPLSSASVGVEDAYDAFDVANVVKRFLGQLPEALLKFDEWVTLTSSGKKNSKITFRGVKNLLQKLPLVNYMTLNALLLHFARIASKEDVNLMSLDNLCTIMGPILMGGDPSRCSEQRDILLFLLLHRERLFNVTAEEAAKDKSVFERILHMRNLH